MEGLIRKQNSNIISQQTELAWTVCGKYNSFKCHGALVNTNEISTFWEEEKIENTKKQTEDDYNDNFYAETTVRLKQV